MHQFIEDLSLATSPRNEIHCEPQRFYNVSARDKTLNVQKKNMQHSYVVRMSVSFGQILDDTAASRGTVEVEEALHRRRRVCSQGRRLRRQAADGQRQFGGVLGHGDADVIRLVRLSGRRFNF